MEGIEESQCTSGGGVHGRSSLTRSLAVPVRTGLTAAVAVACGLALRILMLRRLFDVNGDSLIYGGIARNLLLHGQYALGGAQLHPTLIRLPGYPFFLAACFRLFGMENYWAAACVQIALELAGCVLLADFTRRAAQGVAGANQKLARRVGLTTLWLAALCPLTASYAALPLAEAPTLFALALAMWSMARFREQPGWPSALAFTFAVTWAAMLRPDGALAAVAFAPVMVIGIARKQRGLDEGTPARPAPHLIRIVLVCGLLALAPFATWTWRNWQVFHVFEPLAPRLAMDPGEPGTPGWESWVKTWCLDFVSTGQIYWNVPDEMLNPDQLPARAFDSPAQRDATTALARDYNNHGKQLTPEIDARFGRLAAQRITAHPLRYYVWLPLGRLTDMWLRPRVENLPIDNDWWAYAHHRAETRFSWFYAGLNAFYLLLAAIGLWLRPRYWKPLLAYMLLRSALLLTVAAPETRYTLECFPMIFALGGVALAAVWTKAFSRRLQKY